MMLMGRNRAEDARMPMLYGKREHVGGWQLSGLSQLSEDGNRMLMLQQI